MKRQQLKGTIPTSTDEPFKVLIYGDPGVGKTTLALQWPKPYLLDCDNGARHYGELFRAAGGARAPEMTTCSAVSDEIVTFHTVQHDYQTLIVDGLHCLYDEAVDRFTKIEHESMARIARSKGKPPPDPNKKIPWSRHMGGVNKEFRRIYNQLSASRYVVIVLSHAEDEYVDDRPVGKRARGSKNLAGIFDLGFYMYRKRGERLLRVSRTRLPHLFRDNEEFPATIKNILSRLGKSSQPRAQAPNDDAILRQFALIGYDADMIRMELELGPDDPLHPHAEKLRELFKSVRDHSDKESGQS